MTKSFSIISEKQKLVPKKQELIQFVFLSKLLQRILNAIFHKGEKQKLKTPQTLALQGLKKKLETDSTF